MKKHFKLGRVRILLKEPRSTLSWHRDPEPRLHIPIITNKGCRMVIEDVCKHMPADGSATITNNTKYHNFFNGGEQDRIHLVACVLENPFKKMAEFNKGIYLTAKDIYQNNKGSLLRTLIYTIGHFLIAITVLMLISNVSFMIALTDAIVEPIANAVWYFVLDKVWTAKYKK